MMSVGVMFHACIFVRRGVIYHALFFICTDFLIDFPFAGKGQPMPLLLIVSLCASSRAALDHLPELICSDMGLDNYRVYLPVSAEKTPCAIKCTECNDQVKKFSKKFQH